MNFLRVVPGKCVAHFVVTTLRSAGASWCVFITRGVLCWFVLRGEFWYNKRRKAYQLWDAKWLFYEFLKTPLGALFSIASYFSGKGRLSANTNVALGFIAVFFISIELVQTLSVISSSLEVFNGAVGEGIYFSFPTSCPRARRILREWKFIFLRLLYLLMHGTWKKCSGCPLFYFFKTSEN